MASCCCQHQHCNFKPEGNVSPGADPVVFRCQVATMHSWETSEQGTHGHTKGNEVALLPSMGRRPRLEEGRKVKCLLGVKPSFPFYTRGFPSCGGFASKGVCAPFLPLPPRSALSLHSPAAAPPEGMPCAHATSSYGTLSMEESKTRSFTGENPEQI